MFARLALFAAPVYSAALAQGLPAPVDGLYSRQFIMPLSVLSVTITDSATENPKATIVATLPFLAPVVQITDCPYTASAGPQDGTSLLILDAGCLAPALPLTNSFLASRGYKGELTPENGLRVVYFPNGRDGVSNASLFVTVLTDTTPPTEIWRGHCTLQDQDE